MAKKKKFLFSPGSTPLPGYTIERGIHRGGFGEVYYGRSEGGKEVALKYLFHEQEVELRGISSCINLKHPNLVNIFDVVTDDDGDPWVIMEYVTGSSLREVLDKVPQGEGLAYPEIDAWLSGTAAGLDYMHDQGLIHRDMKPANLLKEQGTVKGGLIKIADVGLAKFVSDQNMDQTRSVGTVYYMSPEIHNPDYGKEVDLYSLGVILYEMLTGEVPFQGESAVEILNKHRYEKPNLESLRTPFSHVLNKALSKDPARRFQSGADLHAAFRKAVTEVEQSTETVYGLQLLTPEQEDTIAHLPETPRPEPRRNVDPEVMTIIDPTQQGGYGQKLETDAGTGKKLTTDAGTGEQTNDQKNWHDHVTGWLMVLAALIGVVAVAAPQSVVPVVGAVLGGALLLTICFSVFHISKFYGDAIRDRQIVSLPKKTKENLPSDEPAAPKKHINHKPIRAQSSGSYFDYRYTPETKRIITVRRRVMELFGGMTFAVFCTVLVVVGAGFVTKIHTDPGALAFFGLTTLLAVWGVLLAGKLSEGIGETIKLRLVSQFIVALMVGTGAFGLQEALLMEDSPFQVVSASAPLTHLGAWSLQANNALTITGYLTFFSLLFVLQRWWLHVDSFRDERFSLTTVGISAVLAYAIAMMIGFPYFWAFLWAVSISSIVQLSAVWTEPDQRSSRMEATHG